jgi:RNA polymerase sigma-70 factor (ECF subfamily)
MDDDLVLRAKARDHHAMELLMRRHNQSLYRAVRGLLRDDAEIEDVMQDTYCEAFAHLDQFEGRAKFSTWLLRIGINQALARLRTRGRMVPSGDLPEEGEIMQRDPIVTPEQQTAGQEMVSIVESAIDELPDDYRQIFVLRVVDEVDTADAAAILGLSEDAVKQRLHRARGLLQKRLEARTGTAIRSAFGFLGARCDRLVQRVLAKLT